MKRTVYLAGPYSSRDVLAEHRAELTRVGYTVRARWLDGQHQVSANPQVEADADPSERARWAHEDLEDIRESDILVAFTSAAVGEIIDGLLSGFGEPAYAQFLDRLQAADPGQLERLAQLIDEAEARAQRQKP